MECTCTAQAAVESPITIIISIVALIVSIIAIVIEKRGSRSQLRIDFFNDHFRDELSHKIPEARQKVVFQNERISGCEELQDVLTEMRRGALYFKYASPRFYNRFVKENQEAEDYFIDGLNKNYGEERQKEFLAEGDKKLHRLYKTINRKYFG